MHKNDNIVKKLVAKVDLQYLYHFGWSIIIIWFTLRLGCLQLTLLLLCWKNAQNYVFFIRLIKTVEFGRNMPKDLSVLWCIKSIFLKISFGILSGEFQKNK